MRPRVHQPIGEKSSCRLRRSSTEEREWILLGQKLLPTQTSSVKVCGAFLVSLHIGKLVSPSLPEVFPEVNTPGQRDWGRVGYRPAEAKSCLVVCFSF